MRMRLRPTRYGGLTLIEVLCALAIAAMLLATLAGTLTLTARAMTEAGRSAHRCRVAGGVERVLRRDVQGTVRVSEQNLAAFIGRPNSLTDEPVLEFFTTSTLGSGAAPGAGVCRVAYRLRPVEGTETRELLRREAPYTPGKPFPDRPFERLAGGITLWRMTFFDGARWIEQWQRDVPPAALRIELTFEGEAAESAREILFAPVVTSRLAPAY